MSTLAERFEAKVRRGDNCWEWTGTRSGAGYGYLRIRKGVAGYAHRVAYMLAYGQIPEGMEIDHLCRNRICVRPDHLEAVTHQENCRRAGGRPRRKNLGDYCKHGHPRTPENTGLNVYGSRFCRPCHRANVARHRALATA